MKKLRIFWELIIHRIIKEIKITCDFYKGNYFEEDADYNCIFLENKVDKKITLPEFVSSNISTKVIDEQDYWDYCNIPKVTAEKRRNYVEKDGGIKKSKSQDVNLIRKMKNSEFEKIDLCVIRIKLILTV